MTDLVPGIGRVRSAGGAVALTMTLAFVGLSVVTVLVGLGVEAWDPGLDAAVTDALTQNRGPSIDAVSGTVGALSAPSTILGTSGGVVLVLALLRRWPAVVVLLVALPLELAVFLVSALAVDRPRPDVVPLDTVPFTGSFPSGHTAAAVALYGSLAWLVRAEAQASWVRRLAVGVAGLAPVGVGLARIQRGMHHLTDVVAGGALGVATLAVGIVCARLAAERGADDPAGGG